MNKLIPAIILALLFTGHADAARGRKPCSGSKGGISHCTSNGEFVCNDGSYSQSKKFCSGYGDQNIDHLRKSDETTGSRVVKPKPKQKKELAKKETLKSQNTLNDEVLSKPQLKKPTCSPIYMANKPGFTNLPICTGNQY